MEVPMDTWKFASTKYINRH